MYKDHVGESKGKSSGGGAARAGMGLQGLKGNLRTLASESEGSWRGVVSREWQRVRALFPAAHCGCWEEPGSGRRRSIRQPSQHAACRGGLQRLRGCIPRDPDRYGEFWGKSFPGRAVATPLPVLGDRLRSTLFGADHSNLGNLSCLEAKAPDGYFNFASWLCSIRQISLPQSPSLAVKMTWEESVCIKGL